MLVTKEFQFPLTSIEQKTMEVNGNRTSLVTYQYFLLCFRDKKKIMQVWKDMMVSKWQQNLNSWVDYSFNVMRTISGRYEMGTSLSHSCFVLSVCFWDGGWGRSGLAWRRCRPTPPQMEPGLADKPRPRPSREPGLSEPPEWLGDTLFLGPDW